MPALSCLSLHACSSYLSLRDCPLLPVPPRKSLLTFCPYKGDIFAIKNEMTAYIFKNYLQDFLLTFTVRYILSHFTFLFIRRFTLLSFFFFFGKTFCSLRVFHGRHYLGELSPATPAAWSAASGPAPVPAPGRGCPHRSRLAYSRVVAAPPSALLASRMSVSAQVRRQLAGQPAGLVPALASAAALTGQPLLPEEGWSSLGSLTPTPPFEVRWTPSPAQMLVSSMVASSCKGDSSGPKNSRIFRILASEVRAPAAAASVRLFFRIRKSL